MLIIPLGDQVLVQLLEDESKTTSGGIVIPDSAKLNGSWQKVRVVELGETPDLDRKRNKWPFKVGDIAVIRNGAGLEIKMGVHRLQLVKAADVLALLDE